MSDTATAAPKKRATKSASSKTAVAEAEAEAARLAAEEAAKNEGDDNTGDTGNDGESAEEKAAREKHNDALEVLEDFSRNSEPRTWRLGKPPENGGDSDTYSDYVQRKMPYVTRLRFFALVSKTIAEALKAGAVLDLGDGTMRERVTALTQQDITDASSFMTLAFQLISYSPEFLTECYMLWLDIPREERRWARGLLSSDWEPETDKWGLREEMSEGMIETFIDQNYEDLRRFLLETLPRLFNRAQAREKDHSNEVAARKSS